MWYDPDLNCMGLVKDHTFIFHLKPFHGILLCHTVLDSNTCLATAATSNTVTRALQHNKEIHSVNASWRIIPEKANYLSFIIISEHTKSTYNQICIISKKFISVQIIMVFSAYLIPKSMCSWIPNPKHPVSLKFLLKSSYSFTFNPLSKSCIALSPLTVT